MTLAWSSSGSFSNSLASDSPLRFQTNGRSQTIFTVPPGSYGPLARLILVVCGRGSNSLFATPGLSFSSTASAFSVSGPTPVIYGSTVGFNGLFFSLGQTGDMHAWWHVLMYTQGSSPSFTSAPAWDSGFSVTATSDINSVYWLSGTHSSVSGFPTITGVGSRYLTELSVGQRTIAPGYFFPTYAVVQSITDDTHFTATTNSGVTQNDVANITATGIEDIHWIAAIVTLDGYTATPPLRGLLNSHTSSNPTLLNSSGFTGLTGTSLSGTFGPTADSYQSDLTWITTPIFDDALTGTLGDGNCSDGLALVQGFTSGSPLTADLVSGNPHWDTNISVASTGVNGQYSPFSTLAHWTRPVLYDTSFDWTTVPAVPDHSAMPGAANGADVRGGFSRIWMWPQSPGTGPTRSGGNQAIIIG